METSRRVTAATSFTLEVGSLCMSKKLSICYFSFTITNNFYSNNSIDINLLEVVEKEEFQFDKLDSATTSETESASGRIGAML